MGVFTCYMIENCKKNVHVVEEVIVHKSFSYFI